MKKSYKVILILAIVLAILGAVLFWQRNNLLALSLAANHSNEELDEKMQTSREDLIETAKKEANITVRDLTEDEKQAIRDQSVPMDEIVQNMITPAKEPAAVPEEAPKKEEPREPQSVPAAEPQKPEPVEDPQAADRNLLNQYLAEIYIMQEQYTSWLEEANQAAIDEFNALPSEKQTTTKKYSIGMKYLSLAKEKEAEADAEMAEQEKKIKDLLIRLGDSTKLVDEIHAAYLNEKAMKKAYYMGLH